MNQERARWGFLVAEAALIVLSILLAFSIDAAWEGRQEQVQRTELLRALRADFAETSSTLDPLIVQGAGISARTGGFLDVVREAEDIPRDSLEYLFSGIGGVVFFQPTVASYRTSLATGAIELVRSPGLVSALTEFDLALGLYELHLDVSADLFYLGAIQDLRRSVGSMSGPTQPQGSPFRALVPGDFDLRGRLAVATAEPMYTVQRNMLENLRSMKAAAERVVSELDVVLR